MSVATFLQEGGPYEVKGEKLIIGFPEDAVFHKESLEEKDYLKLLERIFSEKLRKRVIIELKIVNDHKSQDQEPLLKETLDTFKGKVVNKWHRE